MPLDLRQSPRVAARVKVRKNRCLFKLALLACTVRLATAQSWVQTSAPVLAWDAVASSGDGRKLFATDAQGRLFASTNSGTAWDQMSAPVASRVACSSDGRTLCLDAGAPRAIWISTNSGITWGSYPPPPGDGRLTLSADGTKLVSGGFYSYVYTSPDFGLNWRTTSQSNYQQYVCGIACSADGAKLGALCCAGPSGTAFAFYSSTNSGDSWIEIDGPPGTNPGVGALASSSDGMRLVAALAFVGIYTSSDLGQSWQQSDATGPTAWNSIASSADGRKLVACSGSSSGDFPGQLLQSSDSGASWIDPGAPRTNWIAVASSADGNRLSAVVHNGGIYTWQAAPPPRLNIALVQSQVVLSWEAPSSSVLEQNTALGTSNWFPVTTAPTLTNGQYYVTIQPLPAAFGFYRLSNR